MGEILELFGFLKFIILGHHPFLRTIQWYYQSRNSDANVESVPYNTEICFLKFIFIYDI